MSPTDDVGISPELFNAISDVNQTTGDSVHLTALWASAMSTVEVEDRTHLSDDGIRGTVNDNVPRIEQLDYIYRLDLELVHRAIEQSTLIEECFEATRQNMQNLFMEQTTLLSRTWTEHNAETQTRFDDLEIDHAAIERKMYITLGLGLLCAVFGGWGVLRSYRRNDSLKYYEDDITEVTLGDLEAYRELSAEQLKQTQIMSGKLDNLSAELVAVKRKVDAAGLLTHAIRKEIRQQPVYSQPPYAMPPIASEIETESEIEDAFVD